MTISVPFSTPVQVNTLLHEREGPSYTSMTTHDVAIGFICVANETMCRPIRALTQVSYHIYV